MGDFLPADTASLWKSVPIFSTDYMEAELVSQRSSVERARALQARTGLARDRSAPDVTPSLTPVYPQHLRSLAGCRPQASGRYQQASQGRQRGRAAYQNRGGAP